VVVVVVWVFISSQWMVHSRGWYFYIKKFYITFFFFFFFLWYWGLNSGPSLWAPPPALFSWKVFWDRVSRTICLGWLQTTILLIFASWVLGLQEWATSTGFFFFFFKEAYTHFQKLGKQKKIKLTLFYYKEKVIFSFWLWVETHLWEPWTWVYPHITSSLELVLFRFLLHIHPKHLLSRSPGLFFFGTGTWNQGLHLEPIHQPFVLKGFFKIGSHKLCVQAGFKLILMISPPE
jgi:hypothetical protein